VRLSAPPPSPPGQRAEDAEYEEGGEKAARPRSCKDLPREQVVGLVAPLLLHLLDFGSLEGLHQQLAGLAPSLCERPSHWLKGYLCRPIATYVWLQLKVSFFRIENIQILLQLNVGTHAEKKIVDKGGHSEKNYAEGGHREKRLC
jgi:hypothetical protein